MSIKTFNKANELVKILYNEVSKDDNSLIVSAVIDGDRLIQSVNCSSLDEFYSMLAYIFKEVSARKEIPFKTLVDGFTDSVKKKKK